MGRSVAHGRYASSVIAGEAYRLPMHFRILGPLEVDQDGETIRLGGPKQRLVLAHLWIRANDVVPANLLIDEIWGDEPPEAIRSANEPNGLTEALELSLASRLPRDTRDGQTASRQPV